jgi:hypothetical protein
MPDYHAHDGFYLRLSFGGGYAATSISTEGTKRTYSGVNFPFDLAIGTAVQPNLVVFMEAYWAYAFVSGRQPGEAYLGDYTLGLAMKGLGAGVAYYFMPANIYVSGSLLLHKIDVDHLMISDDDGIGESWGDDTNDSPTLAVHGFATNLMAGKEWWVSRDWGLGVAAQLMLGTAENRALNAAHGGDLVHAPWRSIAIGLMMSATCN